MVFQFPEVTEVKLTHVNVRRELHGDERVPAFDLTFTKEGSNELLDLVDPALRPMLYYSATAENGQTGLPEVIAILPNLRVPKLNGGKFTYGKKEKWYGYRFVLDYGLGDELSNIDIGDCTTEIVELDVKEGGTTSLKWKVSFEADRLSDEVRGRITGLTDEAVFIQLIASSNLQLVKGKNGKAKDEGGDPDGDDGEPDAGDIFAQQHGEGASTGDSDGDGDGESSAE